MIRGIILLTLVVALVANAEPAGSQTGVAPEPASSDHVRGRLPKGDSGDSDGARRSGEPGTNQNKENEEPARGESDEPFPERMPGHKTWEAVLAFPGKILYLPFWVVFQIAGGAIALNETYDIYDRTADFLTADDGTYGAFPVYSSRSGLGLTFFLNDRFNEGSRFNATASWGLRRRALYQARYRRLDLFGGAMQAGFQATFRSMPDEKFFGIGPDSREEDETNYSLKTSVAEIAIGKNIDDRFKAGLIAGFEHDIIDEGKDPNLPSITDPTLPGLKDEVTMSRLGLGLYFDTRNRPVRPSSGFEGELRGRIAHETNDNEFGLTMIVADLSTYVHVFRDRILYLRLAGMWTDPLQNREIPFYRLAELGAVETIRGFERGRFRDRDAVLGSVEYRYPIWRAVDALLFVDAGQMARDIFGEFSSSNLRWTYGGGFRAWGHKSTIARLEVGFSDDGFRVHFLLNPSTQARRSYEYF